MIGGGAASRCWAWLVVLSLSAQGYGRKPLALDEEDALPKGKAILVTGAAGFIGFHLATRLHELGNTVVALDNFNPYYDVTLKEARAHKLARHGVTMIYGDICNETLLESLMEKYKFDYIGHLAAQAGVRYSVDHPHEYIHTNVDCFTTILELLRHNPSTKLAYASSSSVYGKDATILSLKKIVLITQPMCKTNYGASKRMNELLAHAYHHLYNVSATGLRFFTVYGPWGRPDMAPFIFTERISNGVAIDVYHTADNKDMRRDFTYVGDIANGIMRAMKQGAGYEVYNIGRGEPTSVPEFVGLIEKTLGKTAVKNSVEAHSAELPVTFADTSHAEQDLGYKPTVSADEGVQEFVQWYQWFQHAKEVKTFPPKESYTWEP